MGVEINTILKVSFVNTMIKDLPPLLNIICSLSMARTIFKQLSKIFFLIYNLEIGRKKEYFLLQIVSKASQTCFE